MSIVPVIFPNRWKWVDARTFFSSSGEVALKKQRRIQFAWGKIPALWFIVFVIQTWRSRALADAGRDLRTNVPFYFRHVPNQSWLLCCRRKCLFQVKQTDTSGPFSPPPLPLSSLHSASVYFAERVMKRSKTWKKNRRWPGWKKVNYFSRSLSLFSSPFILILLFCLLPSSPALIV